MTTIPYTETTIPNSEMIVFSAKRTFPADIYCISMHELNGEHVFIQDDRFVCTVDYVGVAFDVVMSNN